MCAGHSMLLQKQRRKKKSKQRGPLLPSSINFAYFSHVTCFRMMRCRYLKERFGWTEVTEEAIDNVIDNSDSIELGLDDRCKQAVRHAVGQEKAVVFAYVATATAHRRCTPLTWRRYQLRKVDFLSFAAEKERQRLQKIAQLRSEAINETESVVQPSKVLASPTHHVLHLACAHALAGHRRRRSGAVYDPHAAAR
jgi:hypothetical protein